MAHKLPEEKVAILVTKRHFLEINEVVLRGPPCGTIGSEIPSGPGGQPQNILCARTHASLPYLSEPAGLRKRVAEAKKSVRRIGEQRMQIAALIIDVRKTQNTHAVACVQNTRTTAELTVRRATLQTGTI